MANQDINILIKAREEAVGVFNKVADAAARLERAAERGRRGGGGGAAKGLLGDLGDVQGIFRILGAVGKLNVLLSTTAALSEAMSGNFQSGFDALKKIPFGIGQLATGMEAFANRFTSIGQETMMINREIERLMGFTSTIGEMAGIRVGASQALERMGNELDFRTAQRGRSEGERSVYAIDREDELRRQQINDQERAATAKVQAAAAEKRRKLQRELEAVPEDSGARITRMLPDGTRVSARVPEDVRHEQERRDIRSKLEALSRTEKMELDAVERDAEATRAKSRRDRDSELSELQRSVQEQIEVEQNRRATVRGFAPTIEGRFLTGASLQVRSDIEMSRQMSEQSKKLDKLNAYLDDLVAAVKAISAAPSLSPDLRIE